MSSSSASQIYRPNAALAYLYRRFFDRIEVEPAWLATAREAAARGALVHVLRNQSFIDFLALDHVVKRHGLPPIRFAQDTGLWVLEPMGRGWLEAVRPSNLSVHDRLLDAFDRGGSAVLFLKRPPTLLEGAQRRRGVSEGDEVLSALFRLQRQRERPVLLLPQTFVWSKRPDSRGADVVDMLFGSREWPGKLRTLLQFLQNYEEVDLRAGEVLDVQRFLAEARPGESDAALVRRATYALLTRAERERRAILGPAKKPADRVREEVLRSPRLQAVIHDLAGEGAAERMILSAKAYGMLSDMEAAPSPEGHRAFKAVIDLVSQRIYGGIEVDDEGIARVREAAKLGTVVFLPSHKSHVDYLMLSNVLRTAHLQLPLIAAGDNLQFFPMGPIFRRGGAFFIRRSFKGDRLYAAVVDAYIRRLVREGYALEFFLEGGRSRTGKLLPPKFGLLNIVVDAALSLPHRHVTFLPVSIGYERLLEEGSYARELTGGEKRKEDAKALLRGTRVLGGFYGRVNVQFGEAITLEKVRADMGLPTTGDLADDGRRALVARLGHQVMAEIDRVTQVTAGALVATVLLSVGRRGLPHGELVELSSVVVATLRRWGARVAPGLFGPAGDVRSEAVREAAQLFVRGDLVEAHVPGEGLADKQRARAAIYTGDDVVYTVADQRRLVLAISAGPLVHFFVDRALVAASLSYGGGDRCALGPLRERVQALSRLFKYEFMFRADASFDQIFDATIAAMTADGELAREAAPTGDATASAAATAELIEAGPGHDGRAGAWWVRFFADQLEPFLCGYVVAARALSTLLKGPLSRRDWAKRALVIGERMALAGEISRPEGVCRPILENAISALADLQYVRVVDNKIELMPSFASTATVGLAEARLRAFLGAAPPRP